MQVEPDPNAMVEGGFVQEKAPMQLPKKNNKLLSRAHPLDGSATLQLNASSKLQDPNVPNLNRGANKVANLVSGFSRSKMNMLNSLTKIEPIQKPQRQSRRSVGTIFNSTRKRGKAIQSVLCSANPKDVILHGILNVAERAESQRKDKQERMYQELFHVIDKDKGGTINVSTELGETLIRLGLGIDASVMREAINHVCSRRGRKPDGWFDMNLSTPIYNEIDLDEFQEVMKFLSHEEENEFDHIIKARNVFAMIDADGDGWLSPDELWLICMDCNNQVSFEDWESAVFSEFGERGMSFPQFLECSGCVGNSSELLAAELEEIRKELEECLVTFQTFDLDGSGTIDITEAAEVMRAMGQKVSQHELDDIFNLCDPLGSGEINFESFLTNVLCFSDEKARRLFRAHADKPVYLKTHHSSSNGAKTTSIHLLLPDLFARLVNEEKITKIANQMDEKKSTSNQEMGEFFVWQDFGQYTRSQLENKKLSKVELSKVLNRPFTVAMHKSHADVLAVKFSPDGTKAAIGCEGGTMVLYDLTRPRPREVKRISAHFHNTMCLDWSPDGTKIVTGGADGVVSTWNFVTLVNLACNLSHAGYVRGVTWSPDGLLIASCGSDMSIVLWNADQLRPTGTVLNGHSSWIRWCKFTEDSKRLISSGDDHAVLVWDLTEGIVLQTLRGHSRAVVCGSLVPGSDKLFTAGFDGDVLVWTKDTGLLGYLKVFVVEAFNLKRGDTITGNMSNSRFASVELGKGQRERTAMKKGSSPAWYEEFDFGVWDLDEQVFVQVFDWDKDEAHRFLGSVKVSLDELVYAEEGVTDKEFDLVDDEGEHGKATISLRFTYRAVASIGEVTVFVERARNLPRMDTFGLSDPFCMVSLGKSEKQKTNVVKHNLNPEWNEEFVYNVEEGARELKLVIYDWNLTQDYDFIGQVIIPVETLMANPFTDSWYPLMSIDGTAPSKGEVKLRINFISGTERSNNKIVRFRRNPTTWPAYVRSDFNFYNPVGQVSFFGRVLLRGKCGFCGKHRIDHENDLRCDLGTGNYVHSIDVSHDGSLVAWGTGDGRIRLAMTYSAERIACWTAHAGPVCGLKFSPWDLRLVSWGADHRVLKESDLVRGAYLPQNTKPKNLGHNRNERPMMVVETWYVASLIEEKEKWKKKNAAARNTEKGVGPEKGAGLSDSIVEMTAVPSVAAGADSDACLTASQDHEAKQDNDADDDDEDEEEKEDKNEPRENKSKNSEARTDEEKDAAIKKRLQKGARKIQGRVGYTPVYYDPPMKVDGTLARSCLKGRSGRKPIRNALAFSGEVPLKFTYPPEDLSSNEDED